MGGGDKGIFKVIRFYPGLVETSEEGKEGKEVRYIQKTVNVYKEFIRHNLATDTRML